MLLPLLLTLLAATAPPARGGEALEVRGGEALALEPVGDVDAWTCIHRREGAWTDTGDPYWGGLQMDIPFMRSWGRDKLRQYGAYADRWTPRDQMVVAERARRVRGYSPWPQTARACGLL